MSLEESIRQNFDATLERWLSANALPHRIGIAAIAYVANSEGSRPFALCDGTRTAEEIVEQAGLGLFVRTVQQSNLAWGDRNGTALPALVVCHGLTYRAIMCRPVTIFAVPHTDEFELLLEGLDGEVVGFVGQSGIEAVISELF